MDAPLEQAIVSFLQDGNCDLVHPAVIARFCPKGQTYNAAAKRAAKKKFKTKAKTFALSKSEVLWFLLLFLLAGVLNMLMVVFSSSQHSPLSSSLL